MKLKRAVSFVLAFSLALGGSIALQKPQTASASFTAADFLKTSGKYIKTNSGAGNIVNLRGTNLGGWLAQEDWMSPLGEFAADRTGWSATASLNSASAGSAIDGDNATRWNTGANQANGQYWQVNMGKPTFFNRIYINAAGFTGDQPVGYQILVSSDGTTWKDAATGSGTAQNVVVRIVPQVAQYVKVVQTGSSSSHWWSLAEFNIFSDPVWNNGGFTASASSTGAGYSASSALDGNVDTRWTSGAAQTAGQSFTVNLGKNTEVSKILLDAGPTSAGDYPRGYEVYGSQDGVNWTKYADGYGTGRITYAEFWWASWMQYIKIVQTGSSGNWWSIADVSIYDGNALERTGWTITASSSAAGSPPSNVKDNDLNTVWSTGANQTNGQWLQMDMGANITFNQIVLDTPKNSTYEGDFPTAYTVQVSSNGTTWTQVASGPGRKKATMINFPAVSARYIKITQTGSAAHWWSIGELNVYLNNDEVSMNLSYNARFGAAATASFASTHQDTWITSADLDNLQNIGINLIRLPVAWNVLVNDDGTWKTNAWTKIDWLVTQAAARNIYVLFDLHTLPGGDCPWGSCGRFGSNPGEFWTNTAYQDMVNSMWQTIATHFKNNPAIAGYDLMNEPLIDYGEDADDTAQKLAYYERLYNTVRAIDPDHTIFVEQFFDWSDSFKPSTSSHNWTNVVYEIHPYDMPNGKDWDAQNTLVTTKIADVAAHMNDPTWNSPVLLGEYSLYHYDDVWSKFMGGLNAIHASWTNWSYKVRGDMYEGTGGFWGLYNSNASPVPVINNDNSTTITAKLQQFGTGNFQPNTRFINVVKQFAKGEPWMQTVPLDQTGWTATASSTEAGGSPANALDWNPGTRWATGAAQSNGQWFQVNMGSKKAFDQVSFETKSTDKFDYPRGYQIQVSNDGTTWTTVSTGQGFGWKQAITFSPQYAQFVRMLQTGSSPDWWSIAEFHVYSEQQVSKTGWTASASSTEAGGSAAGAVDGNLGTRWSSGVAQANGQYYQVDLGSNQTFNRILLDTGASTSDYPRGYQIQVSTDGTSWTTVASGSGSAAIVTDFAPQTARYVKVVQTGTSTSWWSIAELNLYGELEKSRSGWSASASATEAGGSTGGALDGNGGTRWSSGAAQTNGQWFQVNLGSSVWFNQIVMDSGSNTNDYARDFIVQVSNDNANWTTVATGQGTGPVVAANFPITQAQYIRVTQTGSSTSWWSISEFKVFE